MRIEGIVAVLTWLVFWGSVAAVLLTYHRRVLAARAKGGVDFSETRPTRYLVVALCVGGLVLPAYFYAVTRTWRGLLIGLGWLVGLVVVIWGARSVLLSVVAPGPYVEITSVKTGDVLGKPGGGDSLYVHVFDFQDDAVDPERIVWSSDRAGDFGKGNFIGGAIRAVLAPGPHVITATATDSDGNQAHDSVSVTVANADQKPSSAPPLE